ncbi:hypothetical protein AB0E01_38815 [Nocardia vinacea]|uniref:hypothetical protein n=1 Tax=Nocardia vinacea TaxID=96468 RepID=UPI0033D9B0B1
MAAWVIVGRLLATLCHELGEIRLQARACGADLFASVCGGGQHRIGEIPEAVLVLWWDAEHFADHGDRQRQGEQLHQIRRWAGSLDFVEPLVHDLLGARAQCLDPAAGERLDHEFAKPRVLRRIHAQQRIAARGLRRGARNILAFDRRGATESRVGEYLFDVLVTGDQPALVTVGEPYAADRFLSAQPRVERIHIQAGRGAEGEASHFVGNRYTCRPAATPHRIAARYCPHAISLRDTDGWRPSDVSGCLHLMSGRA